MYFSRLDIKKHFRLYRYFYLAQLEPEYRATSFVLFPFFLFMWKVKKRNAMHLGMAYFTYHSCTLPELFRSLHTHRKCSQRAREIEQ